MVIILGGLIILTSVIGFATLRAIVLAVVYPFIQYNLTNRQNSKYFLLYYIIFIISILILMRILN